MVRSAAVSQTCRKARGRAFARSVIALVAAIALGALGVCGTAGAGSFAFWQCGGAEQTSGFLAANPPSSPTAFLFSLDAGLLSLCFTPSAENFCPIQGLSLNWTNAFGTGYRVNINNQYSLGFAVNLGAGRRLNYSCSSGTVQGLYAVEHNQGLGDIFGCGLAPPNRGTPGKSGLLFFNGSGVVQSLFVVIDAQTGSGGPMSGFQLTWIDGSGKSRSTTLNNVLSAGVALTLANAGGITYSCPTTPVQGRWAVEPGP